MVTTRLLAITLFALAAFAAVSLVLLWVVFTCREIRDAKALARMRKAAGPGDVDANSTV